MIAFYRDIEGHFTALGRQLQVVMQAEQTAGKDFTLDLLRLGLYSGKHLSTHFLLLIMSH